MTCHASFFSSVWLSLVIYHEPGIFFFGRQLICVLYCFCRVLSSNSFQFALEYSISFLFTVTPMSIYSLLDDNLVVLCLHTCLTFIFSPFDKAFLKMKFCGLWRLICKLFNCWKYSACANSLKTWEHSSFFVIICTTQDILTHQLVPVMSCVVHTLLDEMIWFVVIFQQNN